VADETYDAIVIGTSQGEGYVAKDEASTYKGGATRRWLKVKQEDWTIGDDRWTRRLSMEQ
jgi:ATP-dependent DNA ligase